MYRKSIKLAAVGGIVLTLASSAAFAEGTAAQRQACTPDVFRLCSHFIPNVGEIVACLRGNEARLSEACHEVMFGGQVEPERYSPARSQAAWTR
ncbi:MULTISPECIES: hypothetical protein [unclassified Bradyrhizobium]|jgi:hypothetical protein|uniref:hypothetical protein n=1 Tax=unclassified Bradyrhizobium TaxID=2631580 RepID=UPI00247AE70C|nr:MULTISPECIES: hypothetical protein [unclassified Bradyrhizobium]WGR73816.1 hypothetical protein MTX24_13820 [Bradyrhizobium sp. ISRA426]WGR78653.1 hypothetical protein MTX21_38790 [Bradyrhizobium sp. ISRA430]WGR89055.1 hypothetical protein MTX25_13835 [Bradyrhizobium sp. ISRA432]